MSTVSPDEDKDLGTGIDVLQILRTLLAGWKTIAIFVAVSTIATIIYIHTLTFSYSAALTLVPTQNQTQSLASQFGGLASLAGISLPSAQTTSPFTVYPDTLITRDVADEVIRRAPTLLQRLFRYEWDEQSETWREPASLRRTISGIVKPILGIPVVEWAPPNGADLQEYIAQNIKVAQDAKRPMLTLTYFNPDPEFARFFVKLVHEATDSVLRRAALDRSSKYAKYVENKLKTVQTSDLREVLIQSLSQQETLIMMSSSDTPFAAQPLGDTVSSMTPVQPRPLFLLVAGFLLGAAVGGFVVVQKISIAKLFAQTIPLTQKRKKAA